MNRRALDPRWAWHQRSAPIGHMNAVCEVFRRVGDAADYGFDPATGGLSNASLVLLYRGEARVATNKDWRARNKASRGDSGIQHAVRFQMPIAKCPPVHAHDVIRVVDAPPDMELTHYIFHARNVLMSSNAWLRNILCDTDVAHPKLLPPPYTATVASAATALATDPVSESGCGCG